jgi:guanosine-3',5'-bis(diphosphate) 3'-pyrophosphohydrolase
MATTTTSVETRWEELLGSLPADIDRDVVESAFNDAVTTYGDTLHRTGEGLVDHCLDVVAQLIPYGPDSDLIAVSLLHHVPELQAWNFEEIEKRYGAAVRSMIGEVHVLRHLTTHNRRVSLERLRLNFYRASKDARVFLFMLCHQLVTMRHLGEYPVDERRRISGDVLNLYSPVAARLGMYSLKQSLEEGGFPSMYPVDHERITEQITALREKHGAFLVQTGKAVQKELIANGLRAKVEGREKHPYSVFQKMRHKTVTHIESIPDLFALRVIVDGEAACYQALGFLHRMGYPVQNRFKDYIAFPKPNGYQSLHTTLLGLPGVPPGIMVEVQIRTPEMHREANIGVAAHWSYKEAGKHRGDKSRVLVERALTAEADDDLSILQGVADHMFVLTPKGDVVELPEGATPLDFAFHVHTAVGLSFKAARVNGSIVPMDHRLENGDIVDVVRHKDPKPSPRWISLLKTASARNRLKRHLAVQDRPRLLEEGRDALNRELKRLRHAPLDAQFSLLRSLDGKPATLLEREDLLVAIGQGSISSGAALLKIDDLVVKKEESPVRPRPVDGVPRTPRVEGSIPMPVKLAKCCKPEEVEGRPIVGIIGRSGDVRIHRTDCKMLRSANPERRIHAYWAAPVTRASKR